MLRTTVTTVTAGVAGLVLALAGCGEAAEPGAAGPVVETPAESRVVLQIENVGGFTATPRSRWLRLALYEDGTAVTPAPVPEIWPGPLYEGLDRTVLEPAQVTDVLEEARAVVKDGKDFPNENVADAQTTRVSLWDGTKYLTTSAYALGMTGSEGAADLAAFVGRTGQLVAQGEQTDHPPAALEVWAIPHQTDPVPSDRTPPPAVEWPGKALGRVSAEGEGAGVPVCHVEDDPAKIIAAVAGKNVDQVWTDPTNDASDAYTLDLNPLLPGEKGCVSRVP